MRGELTFYVSSIGLNLSRDFRRMSFSAGQQAYPPPGAFPSAVKVRAGGAAWLAAAIKVLG
jgi:hypothetical protein